MSVSHRTPCDKSGMGVQGRVNCRCGMHVFWGSSLGNDLKPAAAFCLVNQLELVQHASKYVFFHSCSCSLMFTLAIIKDKVVP